MLTATYVTTTLPSQNSAVKCCLILTNSSGKPQNSQVRFKGRNGPHKCSTILDELRYSSDTPDAITERFRTKRLMENAEREEYSEIDAPTIQ